MAKPPLTILEKLAAQRGLPPDHPSLQAIAGIAARADKGIAQTTALGDEISAKRDALRANTAAEIAAGKRAIAEFTDPAARAEREQKALAAILGGEPNPTKGGRGS